MVKLPPSDYPNFGALGEDLVAQWLQSNDWTILHRRFCCRWGEIDLIAQQESILAFIEVKTRSPGNWDAGGRAAITAKKQAKIGRTSGMFLVKYPEKADYLCRFDVAIVSYQKIFSQHSQVSITPEALASRTVSGYQFHLQEYIVAAFDLTVENDW
jgi:putative endonuclease